MKFADVPNGLAAISKVPVGGWAQIAAYFGFVEFSGGFDDYKTGTPGDYGFKVLTSSDPDEKTKKLSAELANGRLAMMATMGMFFQDGALPMHFFGSGCVGVGKIFTMFTVPRSPQGSSSSLRFARMFAGNYVICRHRSDGGVGSGSDSAKLC